MFTKIFWLKTAERATKSFIQGYVVIGGAITQDGLFSFDSLKGAFGLAIASILTSLLSSFKGDNENPSLV